MEFAGSSAWNRNLLSPNAALTAAGVSNPLATPTSTLVRQTHAATSLLFVEANVADYQSLVAGVKAGTEVYILDPLADAVTQITQTLLGRTGISSLHIVSHGEAGGLQLGSTELNGQSLDRYGAQIKSWSQALTPDADILLYGCNVAQGVKGLDFVQRLGQMTGADIAASNDWTGDRDAGGNWTLEVHTGAIAAGLVFQASALANYHHVLPVDLLSPIDPTLVSGSDSTGGSLGTSSVSNDGRYIVFTSSSGSLDATDKNAKSDVFWLDRQTQTLKLVSHNLSKTGSSNGASSSAVISGDGLSVAFVSDGTDLAAGDLNSQKDVFLWKWDSATSTDTLRLVSGTNNSNATSDGDSYNPVISDNGQYVSFLSDATNLTSLSDGNSQPDIFQWDGSASTNAVTLVSRNRSISGSGIKGVSTSFSMSRDGNFVAFSSNANNLVSASIDINGSTEDVFRWSRVGNTMTLISRSLSPGTTGANGESINPVISNDGSRIAFVSAATNLDALDTDNAKDIFLWDSASATANKIRLISVNSAGTGSGNKSADPFAVSGSSNAVISGDGKYVAFTSNSTDLMAAVDANGKQDVFVRDVDGSTTFLVSGDSAGVFGNDVSSDPSISGDGKRISFASSASNLVTGDTNGKRDVFVHNLTDSTTSLISRSATAIGDNDSPADDPTSISVYTSVISADGNFVAFTSLASNLVNRDGNNAADVFIAQLPTVADPTGVVSLVSRKGADPALIPKTGSEDSTLAGNSVSADGRYVVYTSKAPELASNDVNNAQDVFIRDNQTNTVTLISRNPGGSSGTGNSYSPVISRDGQFVVFVSDASDLVAGDTNAASDIFLWDRSQPNALTLISKVNGGTTIGNQASLNPIISGNGQYVVFTSLASNLVSGDSNAKQDVFVWDRSTKTTTLVSHANGNTNSSDGTSENASISDDGRFITFTSDGTNLIATPTTAQKQVFLWDRQTTPLSLISRDSAGTIANAESDNAIISGDGQYVAFTSNATNLFGTDTNAAQDVFLRDLVKNTTTAVSVDSSGAYGNLTGGAPGSGAFASSPVISSYGKVYVAFTSTFNTLVGTDTNAAQDVFVREIDTNDSTKNRTILVSVDKNGTDSGTGTGTGGSFGGTGSSSPKLSQDGRFVAFASYSNNLVATDTNGAQDVFVRDLLLNTTTLISKNSAGTDSGKGSSDVPVISASGGYIAFTSDAGDLVSGDFNNKFDVFGQELLPVVSLTTIDATANELTPSTDPATYQIKRNNSTGELTVKLAIDPTSTAAATDYDLSVDPAVATIVSFSATEIILKFLSGNDTIDLKMTPKDDVQAEADETLKLGITADAANSGYAISTDNTAITTILANDTVVTNTNDSGEGSLRQAIINANTFTGANTISFAIPGTGVQTIALQSALPILSDLVTIDGTTQTGFTSTPLIVLDGTAAGATANGLQISGGSSTVQGLAIKNFAQDGILIDTKGGNSIQQNDLTANQGSGVAIVGTITGNRIQGNTFTGNTGLGIDLGKDGLTANDVGDLDGGANTLQNFPVLTIAEPVATGAAIGGTLNSTPGVQFRVEFFSNDATGTAQGKTFLGFTNVTTDATGNGTFSFTAAGVALGQLITATATDASGNTSELSAAKAVVAPTVSLASTPVTLAEGTATSTALPFIVTLSQPSTQDVVVTYSTVDGTGTTADNDYTPAASASVTFAPGQTTQTISVNTIADNKYELDETFTVTLDGATNATLTNAISAIGTIQNDDQKPTIKIANASGNETDSGSTSIVFTASLSNLSTETVTVDYSTANGTATLADADYNATSGSLTFLPGQLTQTFEVLVNGDTKFEPNETFQVTLTNPGNGTIVPATSTATGTILNDDPGPTLSITTPAPQLEGTSGANTPYLFVVNLSQSSSQEITVDYATVDDTATIADSDYTAASGTLTFAPNVTSQTITVFSNGDKKFEADEQFFVKLTNSNNANLSATDQAAGIITSDDTTPPTLQIANAEASEGNSGTTAYNFVVSLSEVSYQTVTVGYTTGDQTATIADQDYQTASGTLTFAPNETSKTITVLGNGDNQYEGTETFLVNLNNSLNAAISGSTATGTITNDDLLPLASINNVSNLEGNNGTTNNLFVVSLSNSTDQTVTVDFVTADGSVVGKNATTIDNDYLNTSGTVTFNPGEIAKTLTVVTNGDLNLEADEDFFVNLSNAQNAGIFTGQGIGTIVNDDTAPTLKIDNVSQKEGDQNTTELIFTVSLSATSNAPITVDYLTQDGTATIADLDYLTKTGTLTFAPNTLTQTFAVLANGDSKLEGDETFSVKLQNPSTGALISATEGIGIGTIKNDDLQPTIGIDQKISVTEGTSGTLTVSLSNPSTQTVTVHYDSANGTATIADNDYTQASGVLTFNPGELNKTITVSTNADSKFEGDEDFTVTLSQAANADVSAASGQGTVTIVDDDPRPTISIDNLSQNEGNSGTTSYVFTASLSNASTETITVNYDTSDGSATLADSDYAAASGTLTFNPGSLSQKITILANGDTVFEPDENFNVTLSAATKATISAAAGVGKGTLLNDDNPPRPTIRIDGGVTQNEGNTGDTPAYVFNVTLSTSSLQAVTVGYTTKDNSATTLDSDYTAKSGILTFAPGTLSQKITVLATGDNTLESDESFFIDLQNPSSNADISNADGRGVATLTNDDLRPTLNIDSPTKREGASGDITPIEFGVTLSNPSSQIVTVDYSTGNGSATIADSDYIQASGKLTFNPGEVKKTITVSGTGDNKFEADETFTVQLTGANNADITGVGQGSGTLLNDDFAPTISIDSTNASQPENGTPNLFVVNLSNPTDQTVTVNYDTSDGTATIADNDYVRATGTLTFAPSETSKTITVSAVGDTKYESNETFNLNLSTATNATIPVSTSSGTIVNDDAVPTISLSAANASQPENGTPNLFVVTLSAPTTQTVTVNYDTSDGTATLADNDYVRATGTLTFAPSETSKTITVSAVGDSKYESDETFNLNLSTATNATIPTSTISGTIVNDDAVPTIGLSNVNASQPENGTPNLFVVTLSAPTSQTVTVNYDTSDGTATLADNDYVRATGTLTFAPSETSKTITVSAVGDSKYESNETFNLNLSTATNATIPITTVSGAIVNDDAVPTISLSNVNASQPENGTPNLFVVTLSNPTNQTVTVNYDTSDGTATIADNDYIRATGTLTFAPSETSKTITVSAVGDNKYESNETFNLNLSTATNATIPVSTSSGTIVNDDLIPTISLSAANANQPEGSSGTTPYVFTATLSGASSQPITVDYGTTNGTATLADNDYLQAAGKLTFAPTETSKTFTVFANGDTKYEANETFSVSLSNAAIGSTISALNGSVTATIANDDSRPTISLTPNTLNQPEGNGGSTPYVFTVALSEASSETITVDYSTADGSATVLGNDYTAISGKLTFNPGETSQKLTVNATGDSRFEKDETFQLSITNPMNATLTTAGSATATIANDDKDLSIISDSGIFWRNQQTGETLLWQLNSTTFAGSSQLPTQAATWQIEGKGDFNGDGNLDMLWRDTATGEINIWLMNGTDLGSIVTANLPKVPDLSWKVQGVADFTGDGKVDLLWRNYQTGEIATWNLNGTNLVDASYLLRVPDLSWQIKGIGDFNGDRKVDLLWRNDQTGENAIWLLDGAKFTSVVYLPAVADSRWQIEGIGDFNRDGSLDLLWRNKTTNEIGTWELNRTAYVTGSLFSTSLDSTWQVQKIGDFNQDGSLDILWRNTQSGENKLWYLNGTTYATSVTLPSRSDRNWVISDIGDFSRDGSLDLLWHNARSGETDIWTLNSNPYSGGTFLPKVPDLGWQVQATGDFNRDGAVDILWRNYRDGTIAFWQMNGPILTAGVYLPSLNDPAWKIEGTADFDRDGFLDLFWYNDNTGQTAIWTLNGMSLKQGIFSSTPGVNWQVQAIKDFDQDGNVDILWRNQAGQVAFWKMKGTSLVTGTYLPSVPDSNWQIQGVADFNGDGKPDIMWRNYSTGENAIWQLNGMTFEKALYLPSVTNLSWHIEGARDYNGDGTLDLLWRNYSTGENVIWLMKDTTTIALGFYLPRLDPNWTIEGVDDFKGSSIE